MTKKEQIIIGMLEKDISELKKVLRKQNKQLKDINKNGFEDVHPAFQIDIKSGLSYTQGYCTGAIAAAESNAALLNMSLSDLNKSIEESKKVAEENKKYLDGIFQEINKRIKK